MNFFPDPNAYIPDPNIYLYIYIYKCTFGYYVYIAHIYKHCFICIQPFFFSIANYLVLSLMSDIP